MKLDFFPSGLAGRIAVLVGLAIAPLFALAIYSGWGQQQQSVEQAQARLRFSAELAAAGQKRIAESTNNLLLAIASVPAQEDGDVAFCAHHMERLRGKFSAYANLGILEADGSIRCQTAQSPTKGINAADRAYFREAIERRDLAVGEYTSGRVTGKGVIVFARPVFDRAGAVVGVAFASLDLAELQKEVERVELPAGVRLVMTDRNGTVLVSSPDPADEKGKMVADPVLGEAALRMATGTGIASDERGVRRIYAYLPALEANRPWIFVGVSQAYDSVVVDSRQTLAAQLVLLLLAAAVSVFIAIRVGARDIVRPARAIARAALRIEQGDLGARMPALDAARGSELPRIAAAFNLMAESLQARARQHDSDLTRIQGAYDLLGLVVGSMQEAVLALNRHGTVILSNHRAAKLFDAELGKVALADWPARYGLYAHGTQRLLATEELPMFRALRGETGKNLDLEQRTATGLVRTLRCSFQPMQSDDEGVVGALAVIADVTELKAMQSRQEQQLVMLQETQRRLLEAQRTGRIGNWELDLVTQKVWVSDEVFSLFGASGRPIDTGPDAALQFMHPDDVNRYREERDKAHVADKTLDMEYRIIRPDGETRWIHHIGRPYFDDNGKIVRRAGMVQDITERKLAEAELQLLRNAVARINDVVIITEAEPIEGEGPRIVYVNDAFERLTGYGREEVLGQTPRLLQGPDTSRETLNRVRRALERAVPIRVEMVNYTKSGVPYWVEMDIVPLGDALGHNTHLIAVERDISARKASERALVASERRYAALFMQGPLPMWVFDPDNGRFLAVNDAAVRQYGYSTEEFRHMTLFDIRPASEQVRLRDNLETPGALPTGERWLHRRKDGSEFMTEVTAERVMFEDRVANFVVAIDISARLRAETEVQDYVFTLQRMNDAAQSIAEHSGLQETLQEVVEQARSVVGAHIALVVLCDGEDWGQAVSAFSQSEKYASWPATTVPRLDGSGFEAEVFATRRPLRLTQAELEAYPGWSKERGDPSGRPTRGLLAVPLLGSSGRCMGLLCLSDRHEAEFSSRDVYVATEIGHMAAAAAETARLFDEVRLLNADLEGRIEQRTAELTRQEALFRALAEQAPEVVWTANAEGEVTYVNAKWYEITGQAPPQGLRYGWLRSMHPDDLQENLDNWARSAASGATFAGQRRILGQDGAYHAMAYRASPVQDAQGQINFWVGIDTDVTGIKAFETALKRSNEELEAFSYSVSHDLRAPLQAVEGFASLLSRELGASSEQKVQHYLNRIQSGVTRMGTLIEDLISLAQVSRTHLHYGMVDLTAMARDIAEELRTAAPERVGRFDIADGLQARADERLMRIVLQNLMANAWKFTGKRDEAVITLGRQTDGGAFYVRDNGVGFDMAYAHKLFGAFQRLHTEREFPGTGIGLATVKRVINRHQGDVWVESVPGEGTTFYFTLPQGPLLLLPG